MRVREKDPESCVHTVPGLQLVSVSVCVCVCVCVLVGRLPRRASAVS